MRSEQFNALLQEIRGMSREDIAQISTPGMMSAIMVQLEGDQKVEFMIAKNTAFYGDINTYVSTFVEQTRSGIARMPGGPAKENAKMGQRVLAEKLSTNPDVSEANKTALLGLVNTELAAAAAGGKRRKMSRKYCKKTTCKKMGFSQKASCRPYKNCFTRRRRV